MPSVFEISGEELKSEPIKIVRFSHGHLKPEKSHKLKWNCYMRTRARGTVNKLVTASANNITYVGQNFGTHTVSSGDTCDYYLAVRNKSTQKVKVLPAELYRMEPRFEEYQEVDESNNAHSFREKTDALSKEFGSGRSRSIVMRREKNKLDEDMVATTTMKVVESSHTVQQTGEEMQVTSEVSAIPPHNKDAKTPGDVYKLKDIINESIMSSLAIQSQVFYNCTRESVDQWTIEKTYPAFVLSKLETLSVREDARLFQCQCLLYLHCLIKTLRLKYNEVRRKFPLPPQWLEPVKNRILDTFTNEIKEKNGKSVRCMPGPMRDLLLSHILVLCLKLSGFHLELNVLIVDLNIAQKKLSTHCSALGCTIRTSKDPKNKSLPSIYTAILKVPLKFPEVRGKPNKRRIF